MSTNNRTIKGFFTPTREISAYSIAIHTILAVLSISYVIEYYVTLPRLVFTDAELPASQVGTYAALSPAIQAQTIFLGFSYWIIISDSVRWLVYILPPLLIFGGIRKNFRYVIYFLLTPAFWFFELIKLIYLGLAWKDCANFWFCRGRILPFPNYSSFEFRVMFTVNAITVAGVFMMYILFLFVKKALKPRTAVEMDLVSGTLTQMKIKNKKWKRIQSV